MCIRDSPRYGEAADDQFYITETDFNIDFNNDGNIGAPPNNDPLLTGIKATLADGQQNNSYTIFHDQLLQGFSDPDGDFLSIEEGSLNVNNGTVSYDPLHQQYTFTPDTDFSGQVDISYNVVDEKNGSVSVTNSFNINAPQPKEYTARDSQGNIHLVFDQDDYGYARDSQGNVTAISYGEQVRSGMWGSDWRVMAAENIDGVNFNGQSSELDKSLYTVLNVSIPSRSDQQMFLFNLDINNIAAFAGCAGTSGSDIGCHVLAEVKKYEGHVPVRFSFSKMNNKEEVDYTIKKLCEILDI